MKMDVHKIKRYALALFLAVGFVVAPGLSSLSTVQAQGWGWGRDRRDDRRDDRWDRRDDRRDDRWDRRNDRRDERWDGRDGGWNDNREEQKGFRDGLNRGQEDARDRRRFYPNNSSHYRNGNRDYRDGFRRGYAQSYRQFINYRGR